MTGTTVFGCLHMGLTLTGPKKASKSRILHIDMPGKNALGRCMPDPATCCHDDYECAIGGFGNAGRYAMLATLLPKLWFAIENHDWHNCFWMSSWGSPLLDPEDMLQNQQY